MARNSFRLGVLPSAWYLSLFDEAAIQIVDAEAISRQLELVPSLRAQGLEPNGWVEIAGDDLGFELHMPLTGSSVAPRHIEEARSVLGQIVEMDDQARAVPSSHDDDEELSVVKIGEGVVWLEYVSSTVNSEWRTEFTRDNAGTWRYRGIRQRDGLVALPSPPLPDKPSGLKAAITSWFRR